MRENSRRCGSLDLDLKQALYGRGYEVTDANVETASNFGTTTL